MSHFVNAVRAAAAASIVGGLACLGLQTATADPTTTANPDNVKQLAGMLSKGYSLSNCQSKTPIAPELAWLTCGQNTDPNGPARAEYVLLGNTSDLSAFFKDFIGDETLTGCSQGASSPTTWSTGSSNTPAGDLACGNDKNNDPLVMWTNYQNLMFGVVVGSNDLPTLYQWWQTNG